jgi:hypothetical protein
MRFMVGLLAVLAVPSIAAAESYDATQPSAKSDGYIGLGAEFGGDRSLKGGIKLEGGYRIATTPLFVHGQITGGESGTDGDYQQVRAGVEARGCVLRELVCGFAGVDAGYQHDNMIDHGWFAFDHDSPEMTEAHDLMAVPRVGIELGAPLRFRIALDLPVMTRLDQRESYVGVAVSAGVAYAF